MEIMYSLPPNLNLNEVFIMKKLYRDVTLLVTGIIIGFLLSFGMIIYRVLGGSSIYSAMFFEAWQILDIALFI